MGYIEIKDVTYTYPLMSEPTIKNINLSLEKGKFYALIGANASGKTTLCNIIRGFIPSFFQGELIGDVIVDGINIDQYELSDLAPIMGYVFQNPFNQITGAKDNVYEEIAYGLEKFGVEVDEIKRRVEEVMELTNTTELADSNPFELSGGQQQRVALASIIVLEPDILVIDEPTSQLDPQETERIFSIIDKMKQMNKTIILVEHKIELIAEYADEIIVIDNGEILSFGEKDEVFPDLSLLEKGVGIPQSVILSDILNKKGIPINNKTITMDELVPQLENLMNQRGEL